MGISIGVSICAVIVSFLSAVYARRAVNEAKTANNIKLRDLQSSCLSGLVYLQGKLNSYGKYASFEDLENFMNRSVIPASLYLPKRFSEEIEAIHRKLNDATLILEDACEHTPTQKEINAEEETIADIEKRIPGLIEELKKNMRLASA